MIKKSFIHSNTLKRLIIVIIILFFFSKKLFFIFLFLMILFFFLFRKKRLDERKLSSTDDSILLAPISGKASLKKSGGKMRVTIKMALFKGYGISMPFNGDILSSFETSEKLKFLPLRKSRVIVVLKSEVFGEIKFAISRTDFIFKPKVWVRSGDKGVVGAYVGFLPFGGKIVIEMKETVSILLKNNDNVVALATMIASNGIKND